MSVRRATSVASSRWLSDSFYELAKQQQALIVQQRIRARKAEQQVNPELSSAKQDAKLDPHIEQVSKPRELSPQERARIVFGSRLAGPKRREAQASTYRDILGLKVPPRPVEPDNCCMSGCVNCVWELYREDFEYWQEKRKQAMEKLVQTGRFDLWPEDFGRNPKEGAETLEDAASLAEANDDPWKGVDVGIKVFIETEQRLRKRRASKSAAAANATSVPPPAAAANAL
ncbi:hypothetical protein BZA70DRAFT_290687 [Myxozyma melibiosi]|uniref:Oxidoreductase-like domain-containing protein n=1 Tax=Myxozyma melibiosi TaxID=54550 RepID=A0ABR1F2V3_9ASCO